MLLRLYKAASAIEYALAPKENEVTWTEQNVLHAMQAQGYRVATREQDSRLLSTVYEFAERGGLTKMPKVILYEQEVPNAAMINAGTMVVSTGLLERMDDKDTKSMVGHEIGRQARAVIAHEIGHAMQHPWNMIVSVARAVGTMILAGRTTAWFRDKMENWSAERSTPADNLTRAAQSPLNVAIAFSTFSFLWDIPLRIMHSAFTRHQELDADKKSAELTGDPDALIGALNKLGDYAHERRQRRIPSTDNDKRGVVGKSQSDEAPAPQEGGFAKTLRELLASHPPHMDRIARLKQMPQRVPIENYQKHVAENRNDAKVEDAYQRQGM